MQSSPTFVVCLMSQELPSRSADSCRVVKVAGGEDESVMMPLWTEKGLVFISDRSGWWNLYLEGAGGQLQALCPRPAEFGTPPWVFGLQTFQLLPDGRYARMQILSECLQLQTNDLRDALVCCCADGSGYYFSTCLCLGCTFVICKHACTCMHRGTHTRTHAQTHTQTHTRGHICKKESTASSLSEVHASLLSTGPMVSCPLRFFLCFPPPPFFI